MQVGEDLQRDTARNQMLCIYSLKPLLGQLILFMLTYPTGLRSCVY